MDTSVLLAALRCVYWPSQLQAAPKKAYLRTFGPDAKHLPTIPTHHQGEGASEWCKKPASQQLLQRG
jgi:hypothetical protein